MALHHPIPNGELPEEQMLPYLFDKRIKNEARFEMCVKVLTVMDISRLNNVYEAFSDKES